LVRVDHPSLIPWMRSRRMRTKPRAHAAYAHSHVILVRPGTREIACHLNKEKQSTCGIGGYATVCGSALPHVEGGKQSTCALMVDQRHCQPVPCRIATPVSVCGGLLSPSPQKRENNQWYPFCDPVALPLMPHFPNNKNNQPVA